MQIHEAILKLGKNVGLFNSMKKNKPPFICYYYNKAPSGY